MHIAANAYNLKKYLKFEQKRVKSGAGQLPLSALLKSTLGFLLGAPEEHLKFNFQIYGAINKPPREAYFNLFFGRSIIGLSNGYQCV